MTSLDWRFPLPTPHTGIPLGNATTGALIWGEGRKLHVTVSRADLWDHRGGMPFSERHRYRDIRRHLENGDENALRALFAADSPDATNEPNRPTLIPVGRVVIDLGNDAQLEAGRLFLDAGRIEIRYLSGTQTRRLELTLAMDRQLLAIRSDAPGGIASHDIQFCPAYTLSEAFKERSIAAPEIINNDSMQGWHQTLPRDEGVAVLGRATAESLIIANARSLSQAKQLLSPAPSCDEIVDSARKWWQQYWHGVPEIHTPDALINELYYYGMYKFAGFSQPAGIPGVLQGPWIEDHALPPWSGDYHFNINVQMCYWPAFKSGKLDHLLPLFDMIFGWEPILRDNARKFIDIDDGLMLPHAVDDRCVCMGNFWTGIIDHACTAWVADMMWRYVDQSGDWELLKNKVLPFMTGAMRVFEEMLEFDGERYHLPVSVSPEYNADRMNAWGRDSSFQFAAIHCLLNNLESAHAQLHTEFPDSFKHIQQHLPPFTTIGEKTTKRIALWAGQDLAESHRHHSHLAGLCPFDTLDLADAATREIVHTSILHWISKGTGLWSGWCVPWAAMIHARCGHGDSARLLLSNWRDVFLNKGRGSLHDPTVIGFSLLGSECKRERMQLDGSFGAVTAIQDLFVHSRRGVVHVFPAIPTAWPSASFGPMQVEGGIKISGSYSESEGYQITVAATRAVTCRLQLPWLDEVQTLALKAQQSVTLTDATDIYSSLAKSL